MSIKAILFDLDGTLLPLHQGEFLKAYFKSLVTALMPLGNTPKELEAAIWAGTEAMMKNVGEKTNEEVFFDCFAKVCRTDIELFKELAENFYKTEYKKLAKLTSPSELAKKAVEYASLGGRAVVLATNPLFPQSAQYERMSWAGLSAEDFAFVTVYENECRAKPNPQYYLSICDRLGLEPEECLMIGNDEREDMYAASAAGLCCYLVEDCVITSAEHPWQGERGSFAELVEKLRNL